MDCLENSADDKVKKFPNFIQENRFWHFMQIVALYFFGKNKKYIFVINLSSAGIFTQF